MPDASLITAHAAEYVLTIAVAIVKVLDVRSMKKQARASDARVDSVNATTERRFTKLESRIDTLFAHVVGPDGENGLRGDVRALQEWRDDTEKRERERLERKLYDRRTPT